MMGISSTTIPPHISPNYQILNVQVPFYFKSIVDSMNVDFAALGGTAWTVGGAMIVACMKAS